MTIQRNLQVFADYFQIWIEDAGAKTIPRDFRFSSQHLADRVWVDQGLVILFTARNMTVPVEVEITDQAPADDLAHDDHVAEASLEIWSGTLEIYGCGGFDTVSFSLQPAVYRVRMYQSNLGSISDDGLNGDDSYRIVLWRDTAVQPSVLKRWRAPD